MPFDRRGGGGRGFGGGRRFGGSRGGGFGGRSFGEDRDMPKPVKVGEEYDVEISEVGSRGDGIARVKNFVVFVNGTKQGEKAHIKITEVRNRFAVGEKTGEASKVESTESVAEDTSAEEVSESAEGAEETAEEEVSEAGAEESEEEE